MVIHNKLWAVLLSFSFLLLSTTGFAQDATISLQPKSVQAGQRAKLVITVNNIAFDQQLELPAVEGLSIQSGGAGRQYKNINGRETRAMTWTFILSSQEPGLYEIPAFEFSAGGRSFQSEPLQFSVTEAPKAGFLGNMSLEF